MRCWRTGWKRSIKVAPSVMVGVVKLELPPGTCLNSFMLKMGRLVYGVMSDLPQRSENNCRAEMSSNRV